MKDDEIPSIEEADVDQLDIAWEPIDKVMEGAVCHAELWEIEVEDA